MYLPLVDTSEVIDFARDQLVPGDANSEQLIRLAALYESDTDQVRPLLLKLSNSVIYDKEREERKWRFAILIDLLERLPDDPLNAVIELGEFWSNWGFPANSPIASININDYYNKESFERLLTSHKMWIDKEKTSLSK